jgi:hypothetical protein
MQNLGKGSWVPPYANRVLSVTSAMTLKCDVVSCVLIVADQCGGFLGVRDRVRLSMYPVKLCAAQGYLEKVIALRCSCNCA